MVCVELWPARCLFPGRITVHLPMVLPSSLFFCSMLMVPAPLSDDEDSDVPSRITPDPTVAPTCAPVPSPVGRPDSAAANGVLPMLVKRSESDRLTRIIRERRIHKRGMSAELYAILS